MKVDDWFFLSFLDEVLLLYSPYFPSASNMRWLDTDETALFAASLAALHSVRMALACMEARTVAVQVANQALKL